MKITVEKDGQVRSIEAETAIVLALKGETFVEAVEGTLVDLSILLGMSESLADHWGAIGKIMAIMKIMDGREDTTAGKGARQ